MDSPKESIQSRELQLHTWVEVPQIRHFCTCFRSVFHLPAFSTTDLVQAFISPVNHVGKFSPLLIELFYKLCKNYDGRDMKQMSSNWESLAHRRMKDKWRKSFASNFFPKDLSYLELNAHEQVLLLNAICHWKLQDHEEVKQFISDRCHYLRLQPIGMDQQRRMYWYFGDQCWVYREHSALDEHYAEESETHHLEYANAEYIRLRVDRVQTTPDQIIQEVCETLVSQVSREEEKDSDAESDMTNNQELESSSVEEKEEEENDILEDNDSSIEEEKVEKKPEVFSRRRSCRTRQSVSYTEEKIIQASSSDESEESESNSEDSSLSSGEEEEEENDDSFDILLECSTCRVMFNGNSLDPPITSLSPALEGEAWNCLDCLIQSAQGLRPRRSSRRTSSAATTISASKAKTTSSARKKTRASATAKKSRKRRKSSTEKSKKRKKTSKHILARNPEPTLAFHRNALAQLKKSKTIRLNRRFERDFPESPLPRTGWCVISNSIEQLQQVIQSLKSQNSSMATDQDHLCYELERIVLRAEKNVVTQVKKRQNQPLQQLAAPRRQSSRRAEASIRNLMQESSFEEEDDYSYSRRRPQRQTTARVTESSSRHKASPNKRWIDWTSSQMQSDPILKICQCLIDRILAEPVSGPFSQPVNPQLDGCPDYLHVVQTPMDFGTIQLRIQHAYYAQSWDKFTQDVDQVFQNCRLYNAPQTIIGQNGAFLDELFQIMKREAEKSGFTSRAVNLEQVDKTLSSVSRPTPSNPEAMAVDHQKIVNDQGLEEETPKTETHDNSSDSSSSHSSSSDGYAHSTSSSSSDDEIP